MNYKPESVQFAFYLPDPTSPDALAMWQSAFQQTPSSFQKNPPGGPEGGRASDIWEGMNATLATQPGRIDIFLAGVEERPNEFPYLKSLDSAQSHIKVLAKRIMTRPGIRVAVVTVLSELHKSPIDSVRAFAAVTGTKVPDRASDLIFALNVPRHQQSIGMTLNRILRSEVMTRQKIMLQGTLGGMTTQHLSATLDFLALTVDVNTVPTGQQLQPPKLEKALDAVISETRLLISEGYSRILANG